MSIPRRLREQLGRRALVDGIPFEMPVASQDAAALMAVFPIDLQKAASLLPGKEIHPLRVWNSGALIITVVNYKKTVIGNYIEYSIAIACTHGQRAAPRLLPLALQRTFGTGQFVIDLPVSTEISVKGGKGIWGMPKHQANLDFMVSDQFASSQYEMDDKLALRVSVALPNSDFLPISLAAVNYCQFRGMLMKSTIYFSGRGGFSLGSRDTAQLLIGDHPRVAYLKELKISPKAIFTAYLPHVQGVLDDHFESWFLLSDKLPLELPEGMEAVVSLGQGREWLSPPCAEGRLLSPDSNMQ